MVSLQVRLFHFVQIVTLIFCIVAWSVEAWARPPLAAYVANTTDDTVSVIALDTLQVVATINVGDAPIFAASTPDGLQVYVSNFDDNTVSVIDTTSGDVTTVAVGTSPTGIAGSPDSLLAYVANSGSSNISVIDTATNTVIETFGTPPNPNRVAFHPVRPELWIGFNTGGTVIEARSTVDHSVLASACSASRAYAGELKSCS